MIYKDDICGHSTGVIGDINPSSTIWLTVRTDDATHTPRAGESIYNSHNGAFWENQGGSKAGLKMAWERAGKGYCFGTYGAEGVGPRSGAKCTPASAFI